MGGEGRELGSRRGDRVPVAEQASDRQQAVKNSCPLSGCGGVLLRMMPSDPPPALREFIAHRSESSFRELVREHSPMVFATALRKLGGNRAAAQDVTQEVFTLLARKADKLDAVVLAGWLYRQTCRRAANHVRSETRRKSREIAAMPANETTTPADALDSRLLARELDDAMLGLPTADRDALVLRYFEGKEYRAIGQSLGLGEDATRKRIQRALDRLAVSLKRRGIAAGSVSLGTALEGFAATPVSAELVSRLTTIALKANVSPTLLGSLVKPALAGVLATSLVSGTALALRHPVSSATPVAASRVSFRDARVAGSSDTVPEDPTLEQIITEIRRILSSPETVLTELRLTVALNRIQVSQIPEFIGLGNRIFEKSDQSSIYSPLLGRWWKEDHENALDYIVKLISKTDPTLAVSVMYGPMYQWSNEDLHATQSWILHHWDDLAFGSDLYHAKARNIFSQMIVSEHFGARDVQGIFEYVNRIPTVVEKVEALEILTGRVHSQGSYQFSDDLMEQWKLFHQKLEKFPNAAWRRKLTSSFWKNIAQNEPERMQDIEAFIQPSDRFAVALGRLSVTYSVSNREEMMMRGTSFQYEPIHDAEGRMEDAISEGLKSGLSRDQVDREIQSCDDWSVREEGDNKAADLREIELARSIVVAPGYSDSGGEEINAMIYAMKVKDPVLRRSVCRATFRRLLARRPDAANAYLQAASMEIQGVLEGIVTTAP